MQDLREVKEELARLVLRARLKELLPEPLSDLKKVSGGKVRLSLRSTCTEGMPALGAPLGQSLSSPPRVSEKVTAGGDGMGEAGPSFGRAFAGRVLGRICRQCGMPGSCMGPCCAGAAMALLPWQASTSALPAAHQQH